MNILHERFVSKSIEETDKIARKIAEMGIINLGLIGELGAGKTQFCKGYFNFFGVDKSQIVSPSFNILNIYKNSKNEQFYHIDLYRYKYFEDDFGFWDMISNPVITIVEWADRLLTDIDELDATLNIKILSEFKREFILKVFKK